MYLGFFFFAPRQRYPCLTAKQTQHYHFLFHSPVHSFTSWFVPFFFFFMKKSFFFLRHNELLKVRTNERTKGTTPTLVDFEDVSLTSKWLTRDQSKRRWQKKEVFSCSSDYHEYIKYAANISVILICYIIII